MALDPTIALRIRPVQVEQPMNALANMLQLQGAMRQNELGALQLGQQKRQMQQDEAWRGALGQHDPNTPEGLNALMRLDPTRGAGLQESQLKLKKLESEIGKNSAATDASKASTEQTRATMASAAIDRHLQALGGVQDANGARAWVQQGMQLGLPGVGMATIQQALQNIPQDPAQFAQWKRSQMMGGMKLKEQFDVANQDRTFAATNANNLMMSDGKGGFTVNQPLMAAKQGIAAAGKSSISINTGQKGLDNEFKLRGEFKGEPVYKAHQEMQAAHGQIKQAIAQASPAGDLAAATKIMKLLDPGSVVRESELGMAMQASGLLDRVQNYASNVVNGTKLTPKQREDFRTLADRLHGESVKAFNAKRSEYERLGGEYGLNAGRALGPQAADSAPPAAPGGGGVIRFDANGKRLP